jgi:hypothetical protein
MFFVIFSNKREFLLFSNKFVINSKLLIFCSLRKSFFFIKFSFSNFVLLMLFFKLEISFDKILFFFDNSIISFCKSMFF